MRSPAAGAARRRELGFASYGPIQTVWIVRTGSFRGENALAAEESRQKVEFDPADQLACPGRGFR